MRQLTNNGVDFPQAVLHYMSALVERREFAGAVRYYEDIRSQLTVSGGPQAGAVMAQAAKAYASLSDLTTALQVARCAQTILTREGESLMLAELFMTLGQILRDKGETKEAEKTYRDAESIFRRNDHIEGQSRALNQLAGLFFVNQDYKNSLSILMDAIEITRKLGDKKKLAFMMGNIGRIQTFVGKFGEAEKNLKLNIELSTELGDSIEIARAALSLGYVYVQMGRFDEASNAFNVASPHIDANDLKREAVMLATYQGEMFYKAGNLKRSANTLAFAYKLASQIDPDSTLTGRVRRHLAELAVRTGDFREAKRQINAATVVFDRTKDRVESGALIKLKALVAEAEEAVDEGRELMLKAINRLDESGVRFEKIDALIAAGQSKLFDDRQRITYLFRAEEFLASNNLTKRTEELQSLIEAIDYPPQKRERAARKKVETTAGFLTNCESIIRFKEQLRIIARSDLPVLLTGETGVGKDQMARYYHSICRPNAPFMAINCASVPETLLESELFGYRKGSFTGADRDKQGLFSAANGGVLFLDEIGDMPLSLQAKLLGVLEKRKVLPLGATEEIDLDVRLIAATNQNLEEMVERGEFRRDLFYRISGITFDIPALRERKEDIPLLVSHFMTRNGMINEGDQPEAELTQRFIAYDWPGNVRELANKVKKLEVMAELVAEGDLAELAHAVFGKEVVENDANFFDRVEQFERKLITEALLAAGGNKSEAARILGIHEATVRTKLKRYGISFDITGSALAS